jgi:hypothetical protein
MLEEDQKRAPDKRRHRLLEREEFDRLCAETGGMSDSNALLDFLHHNGVARCKKLSGDLSSLAGLTSLQKLNLSECTQISDISPPAKISNHHLLHRGLSLPLETPKNEVYPVNSKKGLRCQKRSRLPLPAVWAT